MLPSAGRVATPNDVEAPRTRPYHPSVRGEVPPCDRTARLSRAHAKQAQTIVCEKREPPFKSMLGPSIANIAPSAPAVRSSRSSLSLVAPRPKTIRRDSRAMPTAVMPAMTGPASQMTCSL